MLFLNGPNNPSGMAYSRAELRAIADVLLDYPDIMIMSDDIYEHIIFSDEKFTNILNIEPQLYSRVVVVNGVSKSYAMTGWRIGYALGPVELIKAMDNVQSQTTSNPNSIAQYASVAALNSGTISIKPMLESFIQRHDYVHNRLNHMPGIKHIAADGAFYAFFDCTVIIDKLYTENKISAKTDVDLANYWLEKFLVAVVPGSAFGLNDHVRISYATSIRELEIALDRIELSLN